VSEDRPAGLDRSNAGPPRDLRATVEITVQLGALFLLVAWCLFILAPFASLVVWALIIAIACEDLVARLAALLTGRRGLAAALLVLVALAMLIVPAVLLSETLAVGAQRFAAELAAGDVSVPPPPEKVAAWPIVGEQVFDAWQLASQNLAAALTRLRPQLEAVSGWLLRAAGSAGVALLQLAGSIVLAGFLLARSEGRRAATTRFASRLAGERGPEFTRLAEATVKSVVQGILGVAVAQAMLAGLGFMVAGVPAAGLWALLVLVAAVVQLPVAIVLVPPILLVFSTASTFVAVAFTIWCAAVALLDNLLKPILFGRGVEVPTLVIFLGAIGGMLTMGIVGLFLGAVVLALGYELFIAWLEEAQGPEPEAASGP
jgi:predicted PurR-regulated permease PerM